MLSTIYETINLLPRGLAPSLLPVHFAYRDFWSTKKKKKLSYLKQEFKNLLGPIERDLKDPACLKKRSFYLSVKQRSNAQPPL